MPHRPNLAAAADATRESVYEVAGKAANWGLSVNLLLVAVKLAGSVITGSAALLADAVNSIGDVASAIVLRGALYVAQRDEDAEHPYGHTKAESIGGLSVALLIVLSAAALLLETIRSFAADQTLMKLTAGIIAAVCAITKECTYRYVNRVATDLMSASLQASALDHRSDAIGSAVVAGALLVSPVFGDYSRFVDPVAAIFVCGYLIHAGVRMYINIAEELMDKQADEAFVIRVRQIAVEVRNVTDVEKLRVRKSGLEYFVEIHIQVDGNLTVSDGHRIGHDVKDELMKEVPRLRDVHVHIEPFDGA